MVWLVPDNLRGRDDVPSPFKRLASVFSAAIADDNVILWYEPLFDPEGELPHFVLLSPHIGVVVLEHLPGKETADSPLLGAIEGTLRLNVGGVEQEVSDPLGRADRLVGVLRERLQADEKTRHVPVGSVAVLSGISRDSAEELNLASVVDLDRCLFKPELNSAHREGSDTALNQVFQRALGDPLEEELDQTTVDMVRAAIHPDVVIETGVGQTSLFSAGADDVIKVMDKKQERLAKNLGTGHRIIRGVAGSGKTLVLVKRAELLARLLPTKKILLTCKAKSLASRLETQLGEHDNVDVVNIDKLMYDVIRQAGLKFPGYEDRDGAEVAIATTAMEALRQLPKFRYRVVLVDEGQDFITEYLKFCVMLLEATEPDAQDLVIVADSAQNIYRRHRTWKSAGINAVGRTRMMRVNYRNTRQTLDFAHKFLVADPEVLVDNSLEDETAIIPPESAIRDGPDPELHVCETLNQEIDKVIEIVKGWYRNGLRDRSIAVLHCEAFPDQNRHWKQIVDALQEEGVFWVTDPETPNNKGQAGSAYQPIVVSTIDSAKGLEFPMVVVCGLPKQNAPVDLGERKRIYVGLTRATDHLAVVVRSKSPVHDDLLSAQG